MTPALKAAVEHVLARREGRSLAAGAAALSQHYRAGGRSDAAIDLAAYLTTRLPATYAAVAKVLMEVASLRPEFEPASLLDAGSGPGTASWAAVEAWPGIADLTLVDSNREFLSLAGAIAAQSPHPQLATARRIAADLTEIPDGIRASLVIVSYALAEIPAPRLMASIAALWRATEGMMVLVEPGTPAGFARIRAARAALLTEGAVPAAPCPHVVACPVTGADWCHFSVRLARSRAHMHAKGARVPFEDEKFSYLAVARAGAPSGGGRILSPPVVAKSGIGLRLCTTAGVEQRHVARRDTQAYKSARKLGWGDLLGRDAKDGT